MRYLLDGQDPNSVLRFNYLSANERLVVDSCQFETQAAQVIIDDVTVDFCHNNMLFPEVILNLKTFLIGYDDVRLINVDGVEVLDRYKDLDMLKRINVRYHLTRTEFKWLIDAGGYTADGFESQLQQSLYKQVFEMPLKLEQLSFDDWCLVSAQVVQFDLNKNDRTNFGDLFYQLMRRLIVADDSGQRPQQTQNITPTIEDTIADNADTVAFNNVLDMHEKEALPSDDSKASDSVETVSF